MAEALTPEALNSSFWVNYSSMDICGMLLIITVKTGNTFTVMHLQQKTTMMWSECFYYVYLWSVAQIVHILLHETLLINCTKAF